MTQSDHFLENAENCAQLAEESPNEAAFRRYKRMEAAWRLSPWSRIGSMANHIQLRGRRKVGSETRRPDE